MKTLFVKISFFSASFFLFFSSSVFAFPVSGDGVKFSHGTYGTTNGGEFNIDVLATGGAVDYVSFCLEKNEYLNYSDTFYVDSVVDFASNGGVGGANNTNQDFLDPVTKWVYWNYINNKWGKSDSVANQVQNLIWKLENEITDDLTGSGPVYTDYLAQSDFTINGVVKVLNIRYVTGGPAQSQIIGEPVPEPATMLLFGTGVASLAGMARRRRAN